MSRRVPPRKPSVVSSASSAKSAREARAVLSSLQSCRGVGGGDGRVGRLVRLADERKLGTPTPRARRVLLSLGDRSFDPKSMRQMMSCEPSGMRSLETSTVSATASRRCAAAGAAAEKLGSLRRHRSRNRSESARPASDASLRSTSASAPMTDARLSSSALFSITLRSMVVFWNGIRSPTHTSHRSFTEVDFTDVSGETRRRRRAHPATLHAEVVARTGCPSAPGTCPRRARRPEAHRSFCRSFCTLGSSASGGSGALAGRWKRSWARRRPSRARDRTPLCARQGVTRSSRCFRARAHAGVKDSPAASDHASAKKRATERDHERLDQRRVVRRRRGQRRRRVERVLVQKGIRAGGDGAETHAEGRLVRKVLLGLVRAQRSARRGARLVQLLAARAERRPKPGTTRGAARARWRRRPWPPPTVAALNAGGRARPNTRLVALRGRFGVFVAFHAHARCGE